MSETAQAQARLAVELALTLEATGTPLSREGTAAWLQELLRYPEERVQDAMVAARREHQGRLTLAALVQRVDAMDGRPPADEAWALVVRLEDPRVTSVITDEAAAAWQVVRDLARTDEVGARVAFRAAYDQLVREARAQQKPCRWFLSEGSDAGRKEAVIRDAVARGRLVPSQVPGVLQLGAGGPSPALRGLLPGPGQGELCISAFVALKSLGGTDDRERRTKVRTALYAVQERYPQLHQAAARGDAGAREELAALQRAAGAEAQAEHKSEPEELARARAQYLAADRALAGYLWDCATQKEKPSPGEVARRRKDIAKAEHAFEAQLLRWIRAPVKGQGGSTGPGRAGGVT